MLIYKVEKSMYAGNLDVICIIQLLPEGRFHTMVLCENPLPGPIIPTDQLEFIRLKSKMHHTTGFSTLEEAIKNIKFDLLERIDILEDNVILDHYYITENYHATLILPNWIKKNIKLSECFNLGEKRETSIKVSDSQIII